MKAGMSIVELAQELTRQQETKRDFIAANSAIQMTPDAGISLDGKGNFSARDFAHGQMATYTGIPKPYYDRLLANDKPLLANNVNRWLHEPKVNNDRRLLRTLDGQARAFLSDRYRPLDNFDLAEAALPILHDGGMQMRIESCALTETRLYIKAVTTRLTAEVTKGDVVQAGVVISNSEVGAGMIKVDPFLLRLVCMNGAISADSSLRKYHVGRGAAGEGESVNEFFRDETRRADDKAFFMKVQDVIKAAFDEMVFKRMVDKMKQAADIKIEGDPVKVVEVAADKFGFTDAIRGSVLRNLISGKDLSQWGFLNAITATAQDKELDYETATDLERLGGRIVELKPTEWKEIATAA